MRSNLLLKIHRTTARTLNRPFSTQTPHTSNDDTTTLSFPKGTKIYLRGGTTYDDVKQLRLVPPPTEEHPNPTPLASIYLKRNILFGTKVHNQDYDYDTCCIPLLKRGIHEAAVEGDQPQGLATMSGLNDYIRQVQCNSVNSPTWTHLASDTSQEGTIVLEAMEAIAHQVPRVGHQKVGLGTYTDAAPGWKLMAKEYIVNHEDGTSEAHFFQRHGGVLSGVEFAGMENKMYLKDAGGSMGRFFFL